MTLAEFIREHNLKAQRFYSYYREHQKVDGTCDYPEQMNLADWEEQLNVYGDIFEGETNV